MSKRKVKNPAALLACVQRREAANTVRNDQTRQRRFERSFLSSDLPDGNGEPYDIRDGGRLAAKLYSALDDLFFAQTREQRWQAALARLEGRPELRRTLVAIRRFRDREKIIFALKIKAETYRKRLEYLTKIFKP